MENFRSRLFQLEGLDLYRILGMRTAVEPAKRIWVGEVYLTAPVIYPQGRLEDGDRGPVEVGDCNSPMDGSGGHTD